MLDSRHAQDRQQERSPTGTRRVRTPENGRTMTILLLIIWVVLTRAGTTVQLWPSKSVHRGAAPEPRLELDRVAVSLEAGVAALALALIPWAAFSRFFAAWEVLALLAAWPFVLRHALDRVMKLRAGFLAESTPSGLVVPGLPRREIRWEDLKTVARRNVRFGPDDFVLRGRGPLPVVLDAQFAGVSEDEAEAWCVSVAARHTDGR